MGQRLERIVLPDCLDRQVPLPQVSTVDVLVSRPKEGMTHIRSCLGTQPVFELSVGSENSLS